jgi:glycosyltransferase involved in cell wall biosynthesis
MYFLKQQIQNLLASTTATRIYRRLLRRSVRLQEILGLCLYYYRKHAIRNAASLMLKAHEMPAQKRAGREDHQLLIDISGLVCRHDRTGVYRVVSNLLQELQQSPPDGFSIEPIYADAAGVLRYAYTYTQQLRTGAMDASADPVVTVQAGDLFFSADLHFPYPFAALRSLKSRGLRVFFTLHDMIPLSYPQYFMTLTKLGLREWLSSAISVADGMICVSRSVADELHSWILEYPAYRKSPLPIGYFHHGASLANKPCHLNISDSEQKALAACKKRPTFLMVGTVVPYKGHHQVLSAIELLWKEGTDCNLMIVGREGWRVQEFADRFNKSPERDHRLFWFKESGDEMLSALYASSSCLIAASLIEGFGLPLIEAARHGLHIIARDIPVFREVAGNSVFYFRGESAESLSKEIHKWLKLYISGEAPSSLNMPWQTWRESAAQLLHVILNNNWYITNATAYWNADDGACLAKRVNL